MRWIALWLLLAGPVAAEKLYTDARTAHIGPKALAALAMPRQPKDRQFFMGFDTAGHFEDCLTRSEMKQILASLRYFRI